MSTNRWEHLKTSTSIKNRSQGLEHIESGSSQFDSGIEGLGIEDIESLRSQFASPVVDGTQLSDETIVMLILRQLKLASLFDLSRQSYNTQESYKIPYHLDPEIDNKLIAKRNRDQRNGDASFLPRPLTYGYNSMSGMNQKHTCIWSGGSHSWTEALFGIIWVAVHGIDTICAVTRIKDLEQEMSLRVAMLKSRPEDLLRIFTRGLIGKVEDFVVPYYTPRLLIHQIIKKPFGVVSVIPDTKIVRTVSGHKAFIAKYDEEKAIKFLKNEMDSGVAFTFDKTVQTAINALDHLFCHDFKANEIQVFVWKKEGGEQAKALPHIREDLDIEEHLAAIDNN